MNFKMNNLDKQYITLLQDILDNGVTKSDRTGTGTISVFGRQIRHSMKDGFPLLTTKRIPFRLVMVELLWFLRGDTNIKFLVDNDCHIWDGDAYKNFEKWYNEHSGKEDYTGYYVPNKEEFIRLIKKDDEFAKKWGELGPVYGKQWRNWEYRKNYPDGTYTGVRGEIDQIANLINDLKTNPDSRRLMGNAWNVGELDQMVLPPCHYGFQIYTRELGPIELLEQAKKDGLWRDEIPEGMTLSEVQKNFKTRAISLMWNQRSCDTFLGLPFNIASYGLLLEIIAEAVNMVPDELIGNLGDTHLYSNHIEQAKEQIGKSYTHEERTEMLKDAMSHRIYNKTVNELVPFGGGMSQYYESYNIPRRSREPYPLPTLNINTEWWPREGEGGPLNAISIFEGFKDDNFCRCLLEEDIQLSNYQSHSTIKAPLSN
jgi:thymidylate synthase